MHPSAEKGSAESKTNRKRHSTACSSRHAIDFLVEISMGVDVALIAINSVNFCALWRRGKSSGTVRKQVTSALLRRQPCCHGKEPEGKHFRDTGFGSGHSWTQEKNHCFPLKPPKNLKIPFSSLRSEISPLRREDARANCREPGESFQWTLRSPSLLGEGTTCLQITF